MDHTRDATESELIKLSQNGEMLGKDSHLSTVECYSTVSSGERLYCRERRTFHSEIIDYYVSDGTQVGRDGLAALITAGPPGAGKTTKLEGLDLASGYRVIDADDIKERLLQKALDDGDYDTVLSSCLPDHRRILPNELSVLVHAESTDLATAIVRRSMEDGVNVVIAGTLSWPELRNRYLNWMLARDYRRLTIVDVEVDCKTAKQQASDRWWKGRQAAFNGHGSALGGRFTPPAAIDYMYEADRCASKCNENAVAMFNDTRATLLDELQLYVYDEIFGEREPDVYAARDGVLDGNAPESLNSGRYRGYASSTGTATEEV